MDNAALGVLHAKKGQGGAPAADEPDNEASADDVDGVKAVLGILRSRAKAAFGTPANS